MPKKDRNPKARPSGEEWFVYMVRCADASLYTGIAKDVARRCQQHNAGTASRYTRSRRPVKLVYQEARHTQSSALKREAAIKTMDRQEKLTMVRQRKNVAKGVRQIARLEDIPNVGPAVAGDLRQLGITSPGDLPGRDPYALYDDLCRITGQRHDPCVLDTFLAAVRYMEGAPKKPWWDYTAERKRVTAATAPPAVAQGVPTRSGNDKASPADGQVRTSDAGDSQASKPGRSVGGEGGGPPPLGRGRARRGRREVEGGDPLPPDPIPGVGDRTLAQQPKGLGGGPPNKFIADDRRYDLHQAHGEKA